MRAPDGPAPRRPLPTLRALRRRCPAARRPPRGRRGPRRSPCRARRRLRSPPPRGREVEDLVHRAAAASPRALTTVGTGMPHRYAAAPLGHEPAQRRRVRPPSTTRSGSSARGSELRGVDRRRPGAPAGERRARPGRAGPPAVPAASAAVSTSPPRETLTSTAPGFIEASRAASTRFSRLRRERAVERDDVRLREHLVEGGGLDTRRVAPGRGRRR